jgi:hypothetical protein
MAPRFSPPPQPLPAVPRSGALLAATQGSIPANRARRRQEPHVRAPAGGAPGPSRGPEEAVHGQARHGRELEGNLETSAAGRGGRGPS